MASNTQLFPRMLKILRENSNTKEKREALTYFRSNTKKLDSLHTIKGEQYKELCKLVVETFANGNSEIQNEAYETLNVIIKDLKDHSLNLFEAMSRVNKKNRLKILKLLEIVDDNAISVVASDAYTVNFFNNCMCTVHTNTMPWLAATVCTDNLQPLIEAESKPLSDDQRLEEETINYCITLLRRLYKLAALTSDTKVHMFNELVLDKIMLLAYMGHKRQRAPALTLLQQALATDILSHVRTKLSSAWSQYKTALQTVYCKRMLHLVSACEMDWATQWNISIQFLGMDLHRGAGLINNLLSVEEKAFKSTDTIIRRQAFLSWKLLVDNFALDSQELATARRIKLLCIPLNAKNSKTELIALTKLEVWWHVIVKLSKDISKFVNPVITQFLNFCFGPLGDTPLLSSKIDIVASPGKRFFKTKIVGVDALCQLLVTKQENQTVFSPMLEERLPHPISDTVFQECYKCIIHSVGEVLLVLSQLTDAEMKNRYQLCEILWTSLINYVRESKMEKKELMYKDVILVMIELINYCVDKPMIKDLTLKTILPEISDLSKNFDIEDDTLVRLVLKLMQSSVLHEAERKHYIVLQCLLWQCIKSQNESTYNLHAFKRLKEVYVILYTLASKEHKIESVIFELWCILAEVLTKYMCDFQEINEGNSADHNLKMIEQVITFPFMYVRSINQKQVNQLLKIWKPLYKKFEMRADLIPTVKANEVLLNIASAMQLCTIKNETSHCVIVKCLDTLSSSIHYKSLLEHTEVPSIMHLTMELIVYHLSNKNGIECETALKVLSAILITMYGHDSKQAISYLEACKPVIELILTCELEILRKEIANTWETIVSIFKGLNPSTTSNLVSSYEKAIIYALNNSNPDIVTMTLYFLEIKDSLSNNVKLMLEEANKKARKSNMSNKIEIAKKKKIDSGKSPNQVKMVGSFLNKSKTSPKTVRNEINITDNKLSDSDSQDYVFIKTEFKFDVNRLTEHQKESLKRKREDIPALYNDLSQSCSQDTQNIQEWFDKKNKTLEETEIIHTKEVDTPMKNVVDDDANKENKIEITRSEPDITSSENDTKLIENIEQNVCAEKAKDNVNTATSFIENEKLPIFDQYSEHASSIVTSDSNKNGFTAVTETIDENTDTRMSSDSITEYFSSENDFLGYKNNDERLSPSVLDNSKRRNRFSNVRSTGSPKSEETVNNQTEQSNINNALQRLHKRRVIQNKLKLNHKQRVSGSAENKLWNENKRGVKRKLTSDSESDGGSSSRQRKKNNLTETVNDSDTTKIAEDEDVLMQIESLIEDENLSQRTKNEISRLRINMIFDSPLSNSRRSKNNEENNKDIMVKKTSPEGKGTKLKVVDVKIGDSVKQIPKKNEKELITVQNLNKRGRSLGKGRSKGEKNNEFNEIEDTKQTSEREKTELEKEKNVEKNKKDEIKQSEDILKPLPNVENNLFERKEVNQSNAAVFQTDTTSNETESIDSNLNEESTSETTVNTTEKLQTQNDTVEIIESSQDIAPLQKKCYEKQCFIKISKVADTSNTIKVHEVEIKRNEASGTVSDKQESDSDKVQKVDVQKSDECCEINGNDSKVLGTVTAGIENNFCDNEKSSSEAQKVNEDSLIGKYVIGFSSPKTNARRQLKFKPYAAQGRAAHMLGLVTKQAKMEVEYHTINADDEAMSKRIKSKDTDTDILGKKERGPTLKEGDKVVGTCSTRQDRIFSNMKSSDYCPIPPIKLFSNLKNDGEKVFSKSDKLVDTVVIQTDIQDETIHEENIDSDDLPMLEWSSANPPSLTASPSVSILKRHRQSLPEPDPESITPNKRKRVSFADPPVSKEMGYEITTNSSPHKINKFTSRSLLGRKDTPLRLKQVKQKLTNVDSEKIEKEEEENLLTTSEVDLQCERENELLSKIAEELEYSENIMHNDIEILCTSDGKDAVNVFVEEVNERNKLKIDHLSTEFEITQDSTFSKFAESISTNEIKDKNRDELETTKDCITNQGSANLDSSDVQENIFTRTDPKHSSIEDINKNNNGININNSFEHHNSPIDAYKLNITNDSIINALSEENINSEYLEDTVDVQNLTGFNSTASSDEIFCGKLMRTSTQAVESIEEQDTLPVTDSIFGSLPLSQDSQNTSDCNVEIHPELLDSIQPIYPSLTLCKEPIKSIIDQLTNPLWIQHLSTYFANRNLQTIGDIAQLSEREVNRIPVKGNSKIEFVKGVLKCFEKTYVEKKSAKLTSPEEVTKMPKVQSKLEYHDDSQNLSELDVSLIFPQKLHNIVQDTKTTSPACSPVTKPSNTTTTKINPLACAAPTASTSKAVVENSNATVTCTTPIKYSVKTVGTCTSSDSVYSSKSITNKATKSVSAQTALEDLLDEIDVNLVLESAVRRCTPEKILLQYKNKMRHMPQVELERQTINLLGAENRKDCSEVALKTACRACGVNKVLLRLPDIFSADKQFFVKVLNTYRQKIKTSDCLNILDFVDIKDAVCEKCTSSELAEMLSNKLKEEEQEGIRTPITELSNLNSILKRVPMDVIISHTVANDELIPSHIVLDIALQNNSPNDIAQALESQSSIVTKNIFNKLWSPQFAVEHIETSNDSKENLFKMFKAVSSKLNTEELLQVFYESMNTKLKEKQKED